MNSWVCVGLVVSLAFGVFGGSANVGEAGSDAGAAVTGKTPCPVLTGTPEAPMTRGSDGPRVLNPCPGFEWAKTFGMAQVYDAALSLDITSDGGAVVLVRSSGDLGGGTVVTMATVVKLDGEGTVQWQKRYDALAGLGGDIQETSDGGFALVITGTSSAPASLIVYRLDMSGDLLWQAGFEGPGNERAISIAETQDGGIAVGAITDSDLLVFRLNPAGGIVWERIYGDSTDVFPGDLAATPDGGFAIAGRTYPGSGSSDGWVMKIDASGNLAWQKRYIGVATVDSIQTTADGGFVLVGTVISPVTKWLIMKLTSTGAISWQKTYGEAGGSSSIVQTSDGGYVSSMALATTDRHWELALLRITSTGAKVWQRSYGGTLADRPCIRHCVREAPDGNILVAGSTYSFGTGGTGSDTYFKTDAWVLRVFSDGSISATCDPAFGTALNSPTVQGSRIRVGSLTFTSSVSSMTTLDPGATATPGTLVTTTQCSA